MKCGCRTVHRNCIADADQFALDAFADIWQHADVFTALRDYDRLKGKCGPCEFKRVCGGCRARAYEATGDFLAEEPLCSYVPRTSKK